MTVDDIPPDQVDDVLKKVEYPYKNWAGNVDLIRMAMDTNVYQAWKILRQRQRDMKKAGLLK